MMWIYLVVFYGLYVGLMAQSACKAADKKFAGEAFINPGDSSACVCPKFSEKNCRIFHESDRSTWNACVNKMIENGNTGLDIHDTNSCPCQSNDKTLIDPAIFAWTTDEATIEQKAKDLFDNKDVKISDGGSCSNTKHKAIFNDLHPGNVGSASSVIKPFYRKYEYNGHYLILTNGIPNHCYSDDDSTYNAIVHQASEHYLLMIVPIANPKKADTTTFVKGETDGTQKGIAVTGGFMNGPWTAGDPSSQCDIATYSRRRGLDYTNGHADSNGFYHYHAAMTPVVGYDNCALLGYWRDGVPVHGRCTVRLSDDGTTSTTVDLNSCYKKTSGSGCHSTHWTYDNTQAGCTLDETNGYEFPKDAYRTTGPMNPSTKLFSKDDYIHFHTDTYPFVIPGWFDRSTMGYYCKYKF